MTNDGGKDGQLMEQALAYMCVGRVERSFECLRALEGYRANEDVVRCVEALRSIDLEADALHISSSVDDIVQSKGCTRPSLVKKLKLILLAYSPGDSIPQDEALRILDGIANGETPFSVFLRGRIQLSYGMGSDALKSFERAIGMDPDMIAAWLYKAIVLKDGGDTEGAFECIQRVLEPGFREPMVLYLSGELLLRMERSDEARAMFSEVQRLEPKDATALHRMAVCDSRLSHTKELMDELARVIDIDPYYNDPGYWALFCSTMIREERYSEASTGLKRALSLHPGDPDLWFYMGLVHFYLKEHEEAVNCFREAVSYGGMESNSELSGYLGKALMELDRFTEALELYESVSEDQHPDAEHWFNKGRTHMVLGQLEDALVCFGRAVELETGNPKIWGWYSQSLCDLGRLEEARVAAERGLELDPDDPFLWYRNGMALTLSDRDSEAVEAFGNGIRLDPHDPDLYFQQGLSLAYLGKEDASLSALKKAVELEPGNNHYAARVGLALNLASRHEDALEWFTDMIDADPANSDAWLGRGISLGRLERFDEALEDLERALVLDPNNIKVHYETGEILCSQGKAEKALEILEVGIRLGPDDPDIQYQLGRALSLLGREEEALEHYRVAYSMNRKDPDVLLGMGLSLAALGDRAGAIEAFDRLLQQDPMDGDALLNKAVAVAQEGQWSDALAILEHTGSLHPGIPELNSLKGWVLGMLGRYDDALVSLELARNDGEVKTLSDMGWIMDEMGRRDEALELLEKAQEGALDDTGIMMNRASVLLGLGKEKDAVDLMKEVLRLDPMTFIFHLDWARERERISPERLPGGAGDGPGMAITGFLLDSAGMSTGAMEVYQKAVEEAPSDARVWLLKGYGLGRAGQPHSALGCFDKAFELDPQDPAALVLKGDALARLERFGDAVSHYDRALALEPGDIHAHRGRYEVMKRLQESSPDDA